jgi:hypothetical protein
VCAEFNECQDSRKLTLSIEMEEVQIASISEDEREGRDVNLGVEGSNSNGHGRELDKEGHIMKIIEGLQRDAQARRADSRKLMKVRDRQGEFNLKMLKSLERIEKKLEKESDTRDQEVSKPLRGEEDRGVVADIIVSPRSILARKHTVVQARPLPENTENLERMN